MATPLGKIGSRVGRPEEGSDETSIEIPDPPPTNTLGRDGSPPVHSIPELPDDRGRPDNAGLLINRVAEKVPELRDQVMEVLEGIAEELEQDERFSPKGRRQKFRERARKELGEEGLDVPSMLEEQQKLLQDARGRLEREREELSLFDDPDPGDARSAISEWELREALKGANKEQKSREIQRIAKEGTESELRAVFGPEPGTPTSPFLSRAMYEASLKSAYRERHPGALDEVEGVAGAGQRVEKSLRKLEQWIEELTT